MPAAKRAEYRLWQDEKTGIWKARKRRGDGEEWNFNSETTHKASAIRAANIWIDNLKSTNFRKKRRWTVQDAIDKFSIEEIPTKSEKTALRYENALAPIADLLGSKCLEQLNEEDDSGLSLADLNTYEKARREVVAPSTIGYELRVFHSVLECCQVWGYCKTNAVSLYGKRAKKKHSDIVKRPRRRRYLSHEEERRLLEHVRKRAPLWYWRIVFAIETGLRLSEQMGLRLIDIDFQRELIKVVGKGRKERKVPLTVRAREAVRQMHLGTEWVSPRDDGNRYAQNSSTPWKMLVRFAKGAGIEDLRWHDLRRTCGCRLLQERDFRKEDVQVWLGHASIRETEECYAFLEIDHVHAKLRASQPGMLIEHREDEE